MASTATSTAEDAPSLLRASLSGSNNSPSRQQASSKSNARPPPQQLFLDWCHEFMGTSTTRLTIQTFECYDHAKALLEQTNQFSEDLWENDGIY
jgi:hypothetical protein